MKVLIKLLQHGDVGELITRLLSAQDSPDITKAVHDYIHIQSLSLRDSEKYKIHIKESEKRKGAFFDCSVKPNDKRAICLQISDTKGNFVHFWFIRDNKQGFYVNYRTKGRKGYYRNSFWFSMRFILAKIDTNKELQEYVSDKYKRCNRKRLIAERNKSAKFGYDSKLQEIQKIRAKSRLLNSRLKRSRLVIKQQRKYRLLKRLSKQE